MVITNGTKKYPASYFGLAWIKQSVSEDRIEKDENIERPGNLGERVLIQDWENLDFDSRSVN